MIRDLSLRSSQRFLFSTTGGYGHFHPLMPPALALREAGHEVGFAARPALEPIVAAAGFTFFAVGGDLAADPEYRQVKAGLAMMAPGLENELFRYPRLFCGIGPRLRTPDLVGIARKWQPDMFIREAGEYGAAVAAEHLGLPHATVSFAASLKGHSIFEREAADYLDPIRKSWGLAPDPTLASLYRYLYLSYSPPAFSMQDIDLDGLGAAGSSRSVPSTTHFIRPQFFDFASNEALPGWVEGLAATGKPVVYVTLGTEVNSERDVYPGVLRTIIEGLRDMPLNLIVTVGKDKDPADFGSQPSNVHIERYIPQTLLLRKCHLAVMHGGSNSLLQALDAGLPTVLVPLIADQFFNAHVTQSLRLGQVVRAWQPGQWGQVVQPEQLTSARIRAAVEEVLNNPVYRENVARLQAEIHALPDQKYAVELIEKVAADREGVVNKDLEKAGERL